MRIAILSLCVLSSSALAQAKGQAEAEKGAEASAGAWLKLVDGEKYGESWAEAASLFKGAVTKDAWKQQVKAVRGPLGRVISRKLKSKSYTEKAPGAPDGKYVIIQYDTKYEHKAESVETLTSMLDADGTWRTAGYFIR
ncbi:MAG TPA: DUF4019 domain-containing protein [Myxococcaceae bacterium]|nr:DUF4019 domain-containing protein [Myxococcaceae bacterium]